MDEKKKQAIYKDISKKVKGVIEIKDPTDIFLSYNKKEELFTFKYKKDSIKFKTIKKLGDDKIPIITLVMGKEEYYMIVFKKITAVERTLMNLRKLYQDSQTNKIYL